MIYQTKFAQKNIIDFIISMEFDDHLLYDKI